MKTSFTRMPGGVVAARGYLAGAASCGLKSVSGALDLAILVSERPAAAAGVFTRNRVVGAPVKLDRARLPGSALRGVVVNSGCSNSCTGATGLRNARAMCDQAAGCFGVPGESFLVSSTGIIGAQLPMDKVRRGIAAAAAAAGSGLERGDAFARAIMTTDTKPKQCAVRVRIGGSEVRIGGACKGSGMIAPNMATMLSYVTTDAGVRAADLSRVLRSAAEKSFNSITVDGHTSPSDTLIAMANGASGVTVRGAALALFERALTEVCVDLACQIVRDGEGATRMVTIRVAGARNDADAKKAAMAVANSPLVKTAVHGGDPNWGRIVTAAGYAGVSFDEADVHLTISGVKAFGAGRPLPACQPRLADKMKQTDITFDLVLGRGAGRATVWTCDFSKEYVTINADYHT